MNPQYKKQAEWEEDNVLRITVKINKNQDPELYRLLLEAESRSGTARDLMRAAVNK